MIGLLMNCILESKAAPRRHHHHHREHKQDQADCLKSDHYCPGLDPEQYQKENGKLGDMITSTPAGEPPPSKTDTPPDGDLPSLNVCN